MPSYLEMCPPKEAFFSFRMQPLSTRVEIHDVTALQSAARGVSSWARRQLLCGNPIALFNVHVNTTFRFISRNEFSPIEPTIVHVNVATVNDLKRTQTNTS